MKFRKVFFIGTAFIGMIAAFGFKTVEAKRRGISGYIIFQGVCAGTYPTQEELCNTNQSGPQCTIKLPNLAPFPAYASRTGLTCLYPLRQPF